MLHILNTSPFQNSTVFTCCFQAARAGDVILLIEDAVLAILTPEKLPPLDMYVLACDLQARGILDRTPTRFQIIDYNGFVDLTLQHTPIQTWA